LFCSIPDGGTERKGFSNGFRDPHRQEVCEGAYMDVFAVAGTPAVPETIGGVLERRWEIKINQRCPTPVEQA